MSIQRDKILQKFNEEYQRLNEEQRKAVDQIEGPVMVIAGPGTGKTQILSARIGKILLSDAQVDPGNILCLTYTEAGVVAMRRRLLQFIGPDAYKVGIYTFHAFCNDVIQENLSLFEKTALDPVSDLEKIEIMKELIDGFDKNHPLKRYRGDVYFEIQSLLWLFSNMKKEGWEPGFICNKIDEYINSLPERDEYICKRAVKTFKKGDIRWDKIEEEKVKMEKLRAACNEFTRFQKMMRERNRYDFDDMINWVIDAFENNENLLRRYQEQFQYILVDEYQDTSGSQNKIVQLLINFWDKPNVFVVGDDDQSIYRFQGANVENMLAFAEGFKKDLMTVVLTNNYRSVQSILDISKTLIDNNNDRLVKQIDGLSKDLIASHEAMRTLDNEPVILEYETQEEEMIYTVIQVEKLIQQNVPLNSIGIIYRENKYGDELCNYLRLKNIPFYTRRNINILDQPFIRQLVLCLNYLCAEHNNATSGDELLFEILHLEWLDIPPIEIAKASLQVAELNYKGQKMSLREWLYEQSIRPQTDLFDTGLHSKMKETSVIIENLIRAVTNETIQTLLEKLVRELGFLSYVMHHPDRNWLMQLLGAFYEHVKDETRRNPVLLLQEFMDRLSLMRREGLTLPLVQVAGNEKGVNLMTVHGSKGLEFEYVFIVGSCSSYWEKKKAPYKAFSIPDTIYFSQTDNNDSEELRRLFYVAITRAKKQLSISFSNYTNEGKQLEPSMFIAEIQEKHNLSVEKIYIDTEIKNQFIELQFSQSQLAPEIQHLDDELADRMVNNFVMNVSALNNYLKCPLGFYYQNIIRIPSPKNEAAEFGSAIHHALEQLFKKMKEQDRFLPLQQLLQDFNWYMRRHQDSFTKEQYLRRMEYGNDILSNYYNTYVNQWNKIALVELNVRNVLLDGVPLKGKIDKIEFIGKDATVIDYKTGDPEKCADKLSRPNDKNPTGGDYWRQAVFYKIMLDLYPKEWNVGNVEFDFIEPDKRKQYKKEKISISSIDIDIVKEQVKTTWTKVLNKDFYTGCGKDDCHWCNFVKTNKLAIALHELKEEEEESGFRRMAIN
jgi:Superfamily I DNA and RNA helicases